MSDTCIILCFAAVTLWNCYCVVQIYKLRNEIKFLEIVKQPATIILSNDYFAQYEKKMQQQQGDK